MGSRIKNTKRNIKTGLLNSITNMFFPFLVRTAILYVLGEQFLGLSSLFSSVLQVLNLAELGFSGAIVYSMYKPIAENNQQMVCALLAYYKKIYRIIGCIIFGCGIAIMPWITALIHGTWPENINIYVLYLLYLSNTSISYFLFAYKSSLLNAVQRIDIANLIHMAVHIGQYVLQLLSILIIKNYYVFVIVSIIATSANNIIAASIANKKYPYYQPQGTLDLESRKDIKIQVQGLMISKLSDTSRNSFDSIVISSMFGLTAVAIYNNYYYIYNSLYAFMLVITRAMQASIGNSIAIESKEKNYNDICLFQFIFNLIISWCTVCLLCLYQPFMQLWVGDTLMLPFKDMLLFCIYFYAISLNCIRNLYFAGTGLWWASKRSFIMEAICNLALNIGLGLIFGISGILLATIITIIVFNFVSRTNILFKLYFNQSTKRFYSDNVIYIVVTIIAGLITYVLCDLVPLGGFTGFVLKCLVCCVVPNVIMLLLYRRRSEFREMLRLFRKIKERV